MEPKVAVGAGGSVTSDAVKTVPSATAVGKALTTVIELEELAAEEELEETTMGLTVFLIEGTIGFDEELIGFGEGMTGLDEETAGLIELLMILLEVEVLDEVIGFTAEEVGETFLVEEEDVIFLVDEVAFVGMAELVTRAGVAVTALQTWETTGAESATKGLPFLVGALNQNLQKGRG